MTTQIDAFTSARITADRICRDEVPVGTLVRTGTWGLESERALSDDVASRALDLLRAAGLHAEAQLREAGTVLVVDLAPDRAERDRRAGCLAERAAREVRDAAGPDEIVTAAAESAASTAYESAMRTPLEQLRREVGSACTSPGWISSDTHPETSGWYAVLMGVECRIDAVPRVHYYDRGRGLWMVPGWQGGHPDVIGALATVRMWCALPPAPDPAEPRYRLSTGGGTMAPHRARFGEHTAAQLREWAREHHVEQEVERAIAAGGGQGDSGMFEIGTAAWMPRLTWQIEPWLDEMNPYRAGRS